MAKNTAITVKEMHKALGELIKHGFGDRKIALSDDDECNGLHECWFSPCVWGIAHFKYLNLPFGVTEKELADEYIVIS